jgi:hypothetical protein
MATRKTEITSTSKFETTWWKKIGETEWKDTQSGGKTKSSIFKCLSSTDEIVGAENLPIGALYAADRSHCKNKNQWPPAGYDGLAVVCVCVGHHWYIDSRASNCTLPQDMEHRCWVRHGTVGDRITVDKNGLTCGAGAGSFFMGMNDMWHGFLRNGIMSP